MVELALGPCLCIVGVPWGPENQRRHWRNWISREKLKFARGFQGLGMVTPSLEGVSVHSGIGRGPPSPCAFLNGAEQSRASLASVLDTGQASSR